MPLRSQLHVDGLLGNVSAKYRNNDYIAMEVFPKLSVKKSSDLIRIYERNFRLPETSRAHRGEAREESFNVSNTSYQLERHALKDLVADNDAENYDLADLRADTVEDLTDKILRRVEKSVADLFTTTNWSLNVSLAATAAWNQNTTVSDPVPVWDTGATTVILNSGKKPNYGIIPREAFIAAKNHTSVLDRIKYTSGKMTLEMLAGLLDVEKLLQPLASIDSAAEGVASSIAAIYGDVAWLGYRTPSAGQRQATAGYMVMKPKPLVKRYREEARDGEWIEVNMEYQAKIVSSLSGYLIKDVI